MAIRPTAPEVPFHEFHDEIVAWYDHWLKGIDTGIMSEPPIKIWVRGTSRWRYANDWPLPETEWTDFYLRAGNLLSAGPGPMDDEGMDSFNHRPVFPVTMGSEPLDPMPEHLMYSTEPLGQDVYVIGPIALYLHASMATDDGDFIVVIKDAGPDGSTSVLSRGWLKASHRELDEGQSRPWQPYHPHLRAIPVVPGQINEYAIEVRPIANVFERGHRIRLEIWSCDYPVELDDLTLGWPTWSHLSYDKETSYRIYHSGRYPSRLVLPIVPGG